MTQMVTPMGAVVQVPDDATQQAFLSGSAGFPKRQPIPVVSPDGTPGTIDPADAYATFQAGYQFDPKTVHSAQIQAEYGGTGQQIAAGVEGLASGATFGLSRVAERIAGVSPAGMKGRREANPVTSIGGEIAGAVIPSLLSGGTGAIGSAARLAGTLPRAAEALGGAAESGLAGLLPRLAATGIPKIAGAATIGAEYAAGNLISEAALHENGDPELTAEHALATIGFGALLGGGLEAGTQLIGKAAKVAVSTFHVPVPQSMSPEGLEEFGREQTTKAIVGGAGPRLKWTKQVDRWYGGPAELGKTWQELGLGQVGKSMEDNLGIAQEAIDQLGPKLGNTYQALDSLVAQNPRLAALMPESKPFFYNLEKNFVGPMRQQMGNKALADKVANLIDDGQQIYGQGGHLSFADMWSMTKDVGAQTNWSDVSQRPFNKELVKLRSVLRTVLQGTADDIGNQPVAQAIFGAVPVSEQLQAVNKLFSAATLARDIAKDKLAGTAANNTFGLGDHIVGLGGAMLGLSHGNPLGAIAAIPAVIARKIAYGQGNQIIAATAMGLANFQRKIGANLQTIGQGIGAFLGQAERAAIPAMTRGFMSGYSNPQDAFEQHYENLEDLIKSPQRMMDRLQEGSAPVADMAPDTSGLMQAKAAQAAQFLYEKAPKNPNPGASPLFTGEWKPSDAQVASWGRYYDAADNPLSVVDDLARGTISREGVEVMQTIYPKLYGQIQGMVANALVQAQQDGHGQLTYGQKLQLSALFGTPVDATVSPDFGKFLQAQYLPQPPDQAGPGRPVRAAAAGKLQLSASNSSDTEALLRRRTA